MLLLETILSSMSAPPKQVFLSIHNVKFREFAAEGDISISIGWAFEIVAIK